MSTPYLNLLFVLHVFALISVNRSIVRTHFQSPFLQLFGAIILIWMNLVHTAQVASLGKLLGSPASYLLISMGLLFLYRRIFAWLSRGEEASRATESASFWQELRTSRSSLLTLALLALVAVGALLISVSVLANNWDTLAYRFPRVLFYLSSGALRHAAAGLDGRLLNYPYNGSLLYLFLAQYEWTGITWNLVSYSIWLIATVAVFYFPLSLGASARASLFSAALFATTPIVLCLANSTNDELIAGTPILLAAVFLAQWLQTRHIVSLVLFVLTFAIGAGTKLHIVFLSPAIMLAAILAFAVYRGELTGWIRDSLKGRALAVAVAFVLAFPLAGGFVVTNFVSSGKATNSEFNRGLLNYPLNFDVAAQNFWLLSWQMLLSPIPDHALPFGPDAAARAYASANTFTEPLLFKNVKQGPPYTNPGYRFRGLTPPDALTYYEQSLWLGLVPWLLFFFLIWMAANRAQIPYWLWALLLTLPVWHLITASLILYVETVGTYYAYATPLGMAGFGLVLDKIRNQAGWGSRIILVAALVVFCSNLWMAGAALTLSPKRNIQQAFQTGDQETEVSETSQGLRSIVKTARRIHIQYSHWETLFWNVMRLNPSARYYSGVITPDMKPDLMLLPVSSRHSWDTAIPIRGKGIGAFRLGGTMSSGRELVFCSGPLCRSEDSTWDEFFFLPITYSSAAGHAQLAVTSPPNGINPGQVAFLRFTMFHSTTQKSEASPWVPLSAVGTFKHNYPDAGFDHVLVEVSCEAGSSCIFSRTVLPLTAEARPLVDVMPESLDISEISALFSPAWEGTEGSGYWKFVWRLVPGTGTLDAEWKGGGGEKVTDKLTVTSISSKGVVLRRASFNGDYVGKWVGTDMRAVRGTTSWDPTGIWTGAKSKVAAPGR